MEKLIETRGRKSQYDFSDFKAGETLMFKATGKYLVDGKATKDFANKINSAVLSHSRVRGLGWKIARRTLGDTVEITRLA